MAKTDSGYAHRADRVQERLEQAVGRIETAFAGVAVKEERRRRDLETLRAENADLRRTREGDKSRDAKLVRRLDTTIERIRALLEE